MTTIQPSSLSDAALVAETVRAAGAERRATADLVALLAEVDARRLYLGQGSASLFAWCTHALHLSEPAAYSRITAARAARRYPMIVTHLANGDVTLTTITLLAAHLTDENHEALLEAARQKSKRDVERLVASLVPQPDIASRLRKMPSAPALKSGRILDETVLAVAGHKDTAAPEEPTLARRALPTSPRAVVLPLASDRYLLKITMSAAARARLDRARDLLRHVVPTGDPAVIVDRALTVLVEQLETSRRAAARRPRAQPRATTTRRHVPASVRRAVWGRDEGPVPSSGPTADAGRPAGSSCTTSCPLRAAGRRRPRTWSSGAGHTTPMRPSGTSARECL